MQNNQHDNDLKGLEILKEVGLRIVPERPTDWMCKAGCAAGDSDYETVMRIYNAMLMAAIDCPLHGDHPLH